MKVKALVSFYGAFSMNQGEIKECSDKATLKSLLKSKYVEKVEDNKDGDLANEG